MNDIIPGVAPRPDSYERKGDWLQTFTGRQFWPCDPHPDDICIFDIAHALANTCRFNGHCQPFYSVAEHSVVLAGFASPHNQLAALLHDAAEAYLADVPRPVKPYLSGYKELERALNECIAEKFDLHYPWVDEIVELDGRILADEQQQIMAKCAFDWRLTLPPLNAHLPLWTPADAELAFICAFKRFGGRV